MSTNLIHFRPALTAPCASANRKPEPARTSKWWSPLFGWSAEPDYIDSNNSKSSSEPAEDGPESKQRRSRFAPGCFTEEKAKQLRLKTIETETFHDAMYHSSIATRLASDFKNRSDL
ncbi:hypothetical protein RchiOBHm_Chr2g0089411 [Rosa chinensis]|uniref:Uncharacterized protein n=1 Tax=Rosa chinensis TaxID=74649 RepID=A0A2P6RJ98_ROSCH|nr:uncharacterized protein LOC112183505 [Rosa chinensis]PRQ46471.1 hypothetical protein RchiOBHm_Chr2g0089411 [Rosa chinensis]